MDQLCAITNVLEYNKQFNDVIIHKCPCYKRYEDFHNTIINNESYLCCIAVKMEDDCKVLHLKLPVMFGSFIDYTIRGDAMININQYGCLYLDGCVKLIYNFISNNLGYGHVYINRKTKNEYYNVNMSSGDKILKMSYNQNGYKKPSNDYMMIDKKNNHIELNIKDIPFEKNKNLKRSYEEQKKAFLEEKNGDDDQEPKRKKAKKTRTEKNFLKIEEEYKKNYIEDMQNSVEMTWDQFMNIRAKEELESVAPDIDYMDIAVNDYIRFFDSAIEKAPKLDHLANKVNRTAPFILRKALDIAVVNCSTTNEELKNLNTKLSNIYKKGNMFFTLSNSRDSTSKIVTQYRCIYQMCDAQKLSMAASFCSCVKRSINEKINNSQALMYSEDGTHFTCFIDSREMKGAGENVMLSQLVIIPIATPLDKVVRFLHENKIMLNTKSDTNDIIMKCVINTFVMSFFTVTKSNLIKLKQKFPILNLMIYNEYLIINTNGYIQMKYSVKYKFFVNSFEFKHIWPDAFKNYHPHLMYNSNSLYLPEVSEMGLPQKLNVANSNIRGRCTEINNLTELQIFLHSNGASNAAIVHRFEPGDEIIYVSFDGKVKESENFTIPIKVKDPHLRYTGISILNNVTYDDIPIIPRMIHDQYNPIEDKSEAYGLSLSDVILKPKKTTKNIMNILLSNYENNSRLEFIDVKERGVLRSTDKSYNIKNNTEQVVYNKDYDIRLYERKNDDKIDDYNKNIHLDIDKKHPPHMYVYVGFGDLGGGTNEDGIIIDKKLVEFGPKKLMSQTLNVTYSYDKDLEKQITVVIKYTQCHCVVDNLITYGIINSNIPLTFKKTKNTKIYDSIIGKTYNYQITVDNIPNFIKNITSTFCEDKCVVNIHYSYMVPIGVGTKFSNNHGQKGVVSDVVDMSNVIGYTKDGTVVHPLVMFSSTSVIGRTMASQVMSMFTQPGRAFTEAGGLISPQGLHIHHLDPSNKTKISDNKNDLMTTENGFLSNKLSYTLNVLSTQKGGSAVDRNKMHWVHQIAKIQAGNIKMIGFDIDLLDRSGLSNE